MGRAPLHVSIFQPRHIDRLAQVCNPCRSFHLDQDQFYLALGVRRFLSLTRLDDNGSPDSPNRKNYPVKS